MILTIRRCYDFDRSSAFSIKYKMLFNNTVCQSKIFVVISTFLSFQMTVGGDVGEIKFVCNVHSQLKWGGGFSMPTKQFILYNFL